MVNYNLVNERTKGISDIPRLSFLLPTDQKNQGQSNTADFIPFCSSGCQLEFKFQNIKSCTLSNDGNFFSISPTSEKDKNYVLWNGSDTNGLELTPFYLKEIYFSLPSKDYVSTEFINNTIQYYLTFVNQSFSNLMITVSVIGQANNIGNDVKSNGYALMDTLADKIPLGPNQQSSLSNLSEFNLGALLPENKSFFTTLLMDNNVQYILLTKIVDVPMKFFNNLVSRVLGSMNKYVQKDTSFRENKPTNPPATIIFYNENITPIGLDQTYVCDSNCNQVPGKIERLEPRVGSVSTSEGPAPSSPPSAKTAAKKQKAKEEEAKCTVEEVEPGLKPTAAKPVAKNKGKATIMIVFFTLLMIFAMLIFIFMSFYVMYRLYGLQKIPGAMFAKVFSPLLFNFKKWETWIFLIFMLIIPFVCFSTFTGLAAPVIEQYYKYEGEEVPEEDKKNDSYWVPLVIGGVFLIAGFGIIYYRMPKSDYRNDLPGIGFPNSNETRKLASNFTTSELNAIKAGKVSEILLDQAMRNSIERLFKKYPDNYNLQKLMQAVRNGSPSLNQSQVDALLDLISTRL